MVLPVYKASENIDTIREAADRIRKDCIRMSTRAGTGHLGPALSLAEILAVLYKGVMRYDAQNPKWPERDRFILSKGHGCLALYSMLSQAGFFERSLLDEFCSVYDTMLPGHPEIKLPGVEANTGSLGHGIALGMGMALAARIDGRDSRVFVVTGDGELQEGSNWEAAMAAAHHRLDNLIVIVDRNKLQLGDFTENISQLEPLADKWRSFGWGVRVVDGHNIEELLSTFKQVPFVCGKPSAVIASTIKGKGLAIAENKVEWHYKVLTPQQYEELKNEMSLEELCHE
ncbi:MAG TPA: transketolase [Thermoanaerobacterales bacterium]|nr:transketolase [Thermoanaerobacterales bacterium]